MESTSQSHETQPKPVSGAGHTGLAEEHGHHGHDAAHSEYPFLAHHFDSPQQQFDSGKLGIWLFLLTEVLFFSGLFCAYTIYRSMHPEIFVYAHYYLNTNLGALNTCVLLLSSLTAAWAVRNAQLGEKKLLVTNIVVTIACACTFMVVKYVEYSHKFHDNLLWGKNFAPTEQVWELDSFRSKHPEAAEYAEKLHAASGAHKGTGEVPAPTTLPAANPEVLEPLLKAGIIGPHAMDPKSASRPRNAHIFFGIYFFMTALHGFHVLIGIGVWVWLLIRAQKGVFGAKYFGPIDYAALYWHLVDLIWIYLFPLLYLIH